MYCQPRSSFSSASIVSLLIMLRSATMQTLLMPDRLRSRSTTGMSVVTWAVLPGHTSQQIGYDVAPGVRLCDESQPVAKGPASKMGELL